MRFAVFCLIGFACAASAVAKPRPPATPPASDQPPHAWLFGTWTGGLFPVLDGMVAQDCRAQPTVGFSKDIVTHATLLGTTMAERSVATVRATPNGAEFRFNPASDPASSFGCENADELHVARSSPNEISFPNCKAFPYPLQRCSG